MLYTISKNGIGIKTRILIDTRANRFIFINTKLANLAAQYLNTDFTELPVPYTVKGFDGKITKKIMYCLVLTLLID